MRVVVLESGPKEKPDGVDPLNTVIQLAQVYKGAAAGRFRGLGGTSTQWGGQLIPMRPEDMAARPFVGNPASPVDPETLVRYLPEIEELFCACSLHGIRVKPQVRHRKGCKWTHIVGMATFSARGCENDFTRNPF